jgi:hypothetical protein
MHPHSRNLNFRSKNKLIYKQTDPNMDSEIKWYEVDAPDISPQVLHPNKSQNYQ